MKKLGRYLKRGLLYAGLMLITVICLFPFVWAFMTSIKQPVDAIAYPPKFIFTPTFANYAMQFRGQWIGEVQPAFLEHQEYLPPRFFNSIVCSFGSVSLALLLGVPAAYSLARFKFKGSRLIRYQALAMRMAPPFTFLIPFFLLYTRLGLYDTYVPLIMLYTQFNVPLVLWLVRGFIMEVPEAIEESAMIDGASRMQIFSKITLPLTAPGIAATAIICFIFSWNDFVFALILTANRVKTAPLAVLGAFTYTEVFWGQLCAMALMVLAPVVIFTILAQRYIVRGLTFGAIKG